MAAKSSSTVGLTASIPDTVRPPSPEPLFHRVAAQRTVVAQLEVELPSDLWLFQFTARHPDVRVLFFNQLSVSKSRYLIGIEIHGDEGVDYGPELRELHRVRRVERVAFSGRPTRYFIEVQGSPFLLLLARLNVLFTYPVVCQRGMCRVQLMDQASKLRALQEAIRQLGGEVRVTRVRRGQVRSSGAYLTPAQARLFRKAVAVGYFDVPRRVTLENFARNVGLSISWVSTALASVEKKLAEAAIADVPFPTVQISSSTKGF